MGYRGLNLAWAVVLAPGGHGEGHRGGYGQRWLMAVAVLSEPTQGVLGTPIKGLLEGRYRGLQNFDR
jgi:hypothetical protein